MKALSSFWREMPVNCAVSMDLNPVALLPSACRPLTPKTDLSEQENTYGDADDVLSDSTMICELLNLS